MEITIKIDNISVPYLMVDARSKFISMSARKHMVRAVIQRALTYGVRVDNILKYC